MGDLFQVFDRLVSYIGTCIESLQYHWQHTSFTIIIITIIIIIIIIIIFYLLKPLKFNTYYH